MPKMSISDFYERLLTDKEFQEPETGNLFFPAYIYQYDPKEEYSIRKQILNGNISFEDAAVQFSDDKSALENKGNLGYFTAFMMVYDFETAAYTTPIGEISQPVKTKYGYHILKVNEKRKAVGERKVAHIMFKTGKNAKPKKIQEAKDKIFETYELLKNGDRFAEVAERFSEDRSTAVKGGVPTCSN